MKEEFLKLYDFIINSEDPEKMHVLGQVTKSMMCRFIDSYPQWAREYLDTLQAVKWNNYLTQKEAEQIVASMVPKPMWNRTVWEGMMTNLGLPWEDEPYYNGEALYVTMQMICSDDGETLMSTLGMTDLNGDSRDTLFKLIYKLALNKLCDKDKMFNIRDYFKL
jgi:hypothetical protein